LSSIPNCSFVDIHSHVIYGLDDGSKSFEQSIAMLEMAASGGTTDIVGTPHSDLTYQFQPERIAERAAELNAALGGRIRLHHGCDFHLHFENIQDCLSNPTKYTINNLRYLMVEFANEQIPAATAAVFRRMIELDITPVITHPERNPLLRQRVDEMATWIRLGCLVQVTAQSFLGRFGKTGREGADELMQRGMVHFVASDAHDTEDRTPLLGEAFAYVVDRYGAARATALFGDNPRATLTGQYLEVDDPVVVKKKRWFW
jgi:protein-tyrosine phosphatase